MDKLIITIFGLGMIALIYWFFFGKKEEVVEMARKGGLDIVVDGGYKPDIIKVKKGETATLTLNRTDPNSCLEEFILPDFKIKKYLPLNKEVEVTFTPTESGEFGFHCGMNMYHGKVIVE